MVITPYIRMCTATARARTSTHSHFWSLLSWGLWQSCVGAYSYTHTASSGPPDYLTNCPTPTAISTNQPTANCQLLSGHPHFLIHMAPGHLHCPDGCAVVCVPSPQPRLVRTHKSQLYVAFRSALLQLLAICGLLRAVGLGLGFEACRAM